MPGKRGFVPGSARRSGPREEGAAPPRRVAAVRNWHGPAPRPLRATSHPGSDRGARPDARITARSKLPCGSRPMRMPPADRTCVEGGGGNLGASSAGSIRPRRHAVHVAHGSLPVSAIRRSRRRNRSRSTLSEAFSAMSWKFCASSLARSRSTLALSSRPSSACCQRVEMKAAVVRIDRCNEFGAPWVVWNTFRSNPHRSAIAERLSSPW